VPILNSQFLKATAVKQSGYILDFPRQNSVRKSWWRMSPNLGKPELLRLAAGGGRLFWENQTTRLQDNCNFLKVAPYLQALSQGDLLADDPPRSFSV
jgi:hypothetical protein